MKSFILIAFALASLTNLGIQAQSPPDTIVQAASPSAVAQKPAAAANSGSADARPTMQILLEMKTVNAATIKKQAETLRTLDDLQKAAEELKIFSKRG
jgi:hypothetical protein